MVRKYKKKQKLDGGESKQRRLRKSKYGYGDRDTRRAYRKFARSKIFVPGNALAPKVCFIKVRQVRKLAAVSEANTTHFSTNIRGNALVNTFPDYPNDAVDKKLLYYGRLYNRYYVYASKVTMRVFQEFNNADSLSPLPCVIALFPSTDSLPSTSSDFSYNAANFLPTVEMAPMVKYKYCMGIGKGRGPYVVKNKATTKKIYQKNTKTDDDFCGTITATDSTISPVAPVNRWYWHTWIQRVDLDDPGVFPPAEVNFTVLYDVEWSVMLYNREDQAAVVDNE